MIAFIKRVFLLSVIFLGCACANKPGESLDVLDGSQTGVIYFASTDDYDFNRGESPTPLIINGTLEVPVDHNGGAIILSHGSGGLSDHQFRWAAFLRSYGFATFILNHFGPRNVVSTTHRAVRVTEQQMASDIIHAGNLLASDPRIKAERIFHIGWSKGGAAGLLAAVESSADESRKNNPLITGYIAFYPFCGFTGDLSTHAKVLLLHGREDNYSPLAPCERLVSEMKAAGSNITLKVFEGAHHGFDNWNSSAIRRSSSITVRDASDKCTIVFSRQSHSVSVDGKHSIGDYQSRIAFLKACGVRGVNYGGSPKYQRIVEQSVIDFVEEKEGSTSLSKTNFAGTYRSKLTGRINEKVRTSNPEVRLVQKGNEISGTFGNSEGNIFGKVEGSVIKFEWETANGVWGGTGRWAFKPNSSEIVGSWSSSSLGEGKWNLTKIDSVVPKVSSN